MSLLAQEERLASWIAAALAVSTAVTFAIAVLTPPFSGPWCLEGCFAYPFEGIASRYPRDYYWMFPALLVNVIFVAVLVWAHRCAPAPTQSFSLLALVLGVVGAGTLLVDYWVQLAVIQPSLLRGERDGLALLSQFNPHGLFIALEELGFLAMSLSLACLAPVFWSAPRPGRAIAIVFLAGFAGALAALIAIPLRFGLAREYFLEVALISAVWLPLIPGATLLAVFYSRQNRVGTGT